MQPIPESFPIERLYGPLIVAYLLHWGLFGTLSVQLYLYYLAFPKDRNFIKFLVYGIYIIEFVETMLFTHDAFAVFGYGFGDIKALMGLHFYWVAVPIMSGVAIITAAYEFPEYNITELNHRKISITSGIWCGASALCDIIIAICMMYYLMHSNTRTITAVVVLLGLILFLVFPHETFYVATAAIAPKLYANAILVVLNSQIQIVGRWDAYMSSTDMSITTTMMRDITSQSTEATQPADKIQGKVPVVTITQDVFNDKMGQTKDELQGSTISLSV
ncbi:hypothetical protein IW261DRAFT_1677177 [Armillaria novae-zelandiae]|uniref:DUF6534 domain-containing protein n=1 Tax=Armillaria novae-zelandiae TaxID=153914 RepID=A0AA39NN85_9AGAR|nr:hypothetical protein IW261DRAFT_1677177 [Armillaria novae-zelandiae]